MADTKRAAAHRRPGPERGVAAYRRTPEHQQLEAAWSVGTVVGPGVGGILAEPADSFSRTFSKLEIFRRYPYLLPNVVGAGLALLSLPPVLFFLKDTKHTKSILSTFTSMRAWWPLGDEDEDDNGHNGGEENRDLARVTPSVLPPKSPCMANTSRPPREPIFQMQTNSGRKKDVEHLGRDLRDVEPSSLLAQPHIRTLLVIDGLYSAFLICDAMVLVFEMFAVPNIIPRLGVRTSQRMGSVFETLVYLLVPLLSRVNAAGLPVTAAAIFLLFTCTVGTNAFFMGLSLAINVATGPDQRGELNGISATVNSFGRAIPLIICSAMFAFSIDGDPSLSITI